MGLPVFLSNVADQVPFTLPSMFCNALLSILSVEGTSAEGAGVAVGSDTVGTAVGEGKDQFNVILGG